MGEKPSGTKKIASFSKTTLTKTVESQPVEETNNSLPEGLSSVYNDPLKSKLKAPVTVVSRILENSWYSITVTSTNESHPSTELKTSVPLKLPFPYSVPLNSKDSPKHIVLSREELKAGSSITVTVTIEYTEEQWAIIQEFFPIREDTSEGLGVAISLEDYTPTKLSEVLKSHISQIVKRNRVEKIEREMEDL